MSCQARHQHGSKVGRCGPRCHILFVIYSIVLPALVGLTDARQQARHGLYTCPKTGLCLQIEGPYSSYCSLLTAFWKNSLDEPTMLPPNQTAKRWNGCDTTLTDTSLLAKASLASPALEMLELIRLSTCLLISFLSRRSKSRYIVDPPESTTLPYKPLRVSMGHCWMVSSIKTGNGFRKSEV